MGFAFLTFTNAVLEPGIRIVLEDAMKPECARENLGDAAERAFRLMKVWRK